MQITSKPIEEISLELADHIRNIVDNEVVDDVKERMIKILDAIAFFHFSCYNFFCSLEAWNA